MLLTAGALSLALTATAAGVIYVYGNGFPNRAAFKEIKGAGGGNKCDRGYRERSHAMRVTVKGKRLCAFTPPVVGDDSQPDHVIYAKGRLLAKKTPKSLRRAAYLAVRVRAGGGEFYELQIHPKRRFKLLRNPSSGAVSEAGQSSAINALKAANRVRLDVKGARLRAFANGQELVSVVDGSPGEISGRKVAFGLGSQRDSSRETVGAFERVRVGIAE